MRATYLILAVIGIVVVGFAGAELRWCRIIIGYYPDDGWVQYDDTLQSCVRCSSQSAIIIDVERVGDYECCDGNLVSIGNCSRNNSSNDGTCSNGIQCDGIKQCVDGSDEVGCRRCTGTGQFSCNSHDEAEACISTDKVCDGRKDCDFGLDESNCQYHGGWCDGFLCGKPHERCISYSQVCDGVKQCIDGSDEYNCHYCLQQFRCSVFEREENVLATARKSTTTAQCIGLFRVCDGNVDCANQRDETNCYRWREWVQWSECNPPAVCERTRTRECVNRNGEVTDPERCYDVEDYHDAKGIPSVETQTELCPPCIPPPPVLPTTQKNEITTDARTRSQTTQAVEDATETQSSSATLDATTQSLGSLVVSSRVLTSTTFQLDASDSTKMTTLSFGDVSTDVTIVAAPYVTTTSGFNTSDVGVFELTPAQLVSGDSTGLPAIVKNSSTTEHTVVTGDVTDGEVTTSFSYVTSPRLSFTLIMVVTGVAAFILLVLIVALVFCFADRKRKTGKWTPSRRYHPRPRKVPRMYHDIPLDGVGEKHLPTTEVIFRGFFKKS
ncbi:uncharacterized protein LOC143470314 isoform X2 [Clavelina lepadiformis]|uniref:uncharacterized protein LOC143470314 isoform X2 n=1 Tax=Clavelina lepadiformis TaxID=159417 RepID=UPI00404208EB